MAVKVMRRRELTFWEKLYVPQILSGLKVTFAHFFRNMFFHTAHSPGLLKQFSVATGPQGRRPIRGLPSTRETLLIFPIVKFFARAVSQNSCFADDNARKHGFAKKIGNYKTAVQFNSTPVNCSQTGQPVEGNYRQAAQRLRCGDLGLQDRG